MIGGILSTLVRKNLDLDFDVDLDVDFFTDFYDFRMRYSEINTWQHAI